MPVLARNLVATSQPLAAQAGLAVLARGGNAIDAAVATAACLTVVEPTNNGVGSDAFAIVWDGERLHGFNGSGRSPRTLSPERFEGATSMPSIGWDPVTVPGAVSLWSELSARFGALPFPDLLEPAIRYAHDGFAVSPVVARQWALSAPLYADFPEFGAAFLPAGRPPAAGESFRLPSLAATLEILATSKGEALYRGELAAAIGEHAARSGGLLDQRDLAEQRTEAVEPLSVAFENHEIHEIPPNTQGIAALVALGILDRLPFRDHPADSAECLHFQIEAMKLAFAEVYRHVADPAAMTIDSRSLLDPGFLDERARLVDPDRAAEPAGSSPSRGDTVYLVCADAAGRMVSLIQSNYFGFGSGIVVPGTGISLQNRGWGFTLEEGHPNRVGGGKRPFHTIIPGFVTRDGSPVAAFGVMGGGMQPQGHLQMMVRILACGQNPQAAADAPRWRVLGGLRLALEEGFPADTALGLRRRGHEITGLDPVFFGGAQIAWRTENGYLGASEPRKDGHAVGF